MTRARLRAEEAGEFRICGYSLETAGPHLVPEGSSEFVRRKIRVFDRRNHQAGGGKVWDAHSPTQSQLVCIGTPGPPGPNGSSNSRLVVVVVEGHWE